MILPWLLCTLAISMDPDLALDLAQDAGPLTRYREARPAMGSVFEITLYAADETAAKSAFDAAFDRIEAVNGVFSDYDRDSEASRLSRSAGSGQRVAISDQMQQVLAWSLQLSQRSAGAFDVSVGPVTRLWRRARRRKKMPDAERLQAALAATGYRQICLDHDAGTARLEREGMRLDFGGVAKGTGCDVALSALRQHGIARALVNGGGDLAVGAPPPGEEGWRVGVAPLQPNQPPSRVLALSNLGVATSGDAWQYVEIDGNRYSHIVDPRTGLGLTRRSSVTVVAPTGQTADGLASAVSVLGPEAGIRLVEQYDQTACRIVVVQDDTVHTHHSSRWKTLAEAHVVAGSGDPATTRESNRDTLQNR